MSLKNGEINIMNRKKSLLAWILILGSLPFYIQADIFDQMGTDILSIPDTFKKVGKGFKERKLIIDDDDSKAAEAKNTISFNNNSADTIQAKLQFIYPHGEIFTVPKNLLPKKSGQSHSSTGCLIKLSIITASKPKDAQYKDTGGTFVYSGKAGCGSRTISISRDGNEYKVQGAGVVETPRAKETAIFTCKNNSSDVIKITLQSIEGLQILHQTYHLEPNQFITIGRQTCLNKISINTYKKPHDAQYKDASWDHIYSGKARCADHTISVSRDGNTYKVTGKTGQKILEKRTGLIKSPAIYR